MKMNDSVLWVYGVLMVGLVGCHDDTSPSAAEVIAKPPVDSISAAPEARVIALSREGEVASLGINPPWPVLAKANLNDMINSVHCRAGRCAVVHPDPINAVTIVDAQNLKVLDRIELGKQTDPRDVAFTSDQTIVISLYQQPYLLEYNLMQLQQQPRQIDLSYLADADGLPEANMLGSCGRQVYVQLQRLDHVDMQPSKQPAVLAVINTWQADAIHHMPLSSTPALDLRVDCAARTVLVAQPKVIMQGGGTVEKVDLKTAKVSTALQADEFANGGMLQISPTQYWLNQHTDTGPGPSSHLTMIGGQTDEVYNVFAHEHVDNFEYDAITRLLFYPNPCSTLQPIGCDDGVHVFDGLTGQSKGNSIQLGFAPIELTISR